MVDIVKGQIFTDEAVEVDDKVFFGCQFIRSTLVYKGGSLPAFNKCVFEEPDISFIGAAANTLAFLRSLYHSPFKPQVESTFEHIKSGRVGNDGNTEVRQKAE
jgi:hypothetical protein